MSPERAAYKRAWEYANREWRNARRRDRWRIDKVYRDKALACVRRSREKHDPETRRLARVKYWLKSEYGLSVEEYALLYNQQGSKCAICRTSGTRLEVDHDHETGRVRGLLCRGCNMRLDFVEIHQKAIACYLGWA